MGREVRHGEKGEACGESVRHGREGEACGEIGEAWG